MGAPAPGAGKVGHHCCTAFSNGRVTDQVSFDNVFLGPYMCRKFEPYSRLSSGRRGEKRRPRPWGRLPGDARLALCHSLPDSLGGREAPAALCRWPLGQQASGLLGCGKCSLLGRARRKSSSGHTEGRTVDAAGRAAVPAPAPWLLGGRAVQHCGRWGLGLGGPEGGPGLATHPALQRGRQKRVGAGSPMRLREETCRVSVPPLQRRGQMPM